MDCWYFLVIIKTNSTLKWPLRSLPMTVVAGVFPMIVPGCNRTYSHETAALHLHDYFGDVWIGPRRFQLQPGDITLSPGNVPSRYALTEGGQHLCIHFFSTSEMPGRNSIHLPLHSRLGPRTVAARERIWRVIDYVRQSGGKSHSPAGSAAAAALQELLLWLHLQGHRGATPRRVTLADEALAKLKKAIDASLGNPRLVGELADGVGLSSDYVARLFARRHGMTLQHYLLLRRMELARHLLLASDLLVSEVGNKVGIPDPQYFNKQFRRVVGQSPLAYRRQRASGNRFIRKSGNF
jgi:AraC-like DNA-binding protein